MIPHNHDINFCNKNANKLNWWIGFLLEWIKLSRRCQGVFKYPNRPSVQIYSTSYFAILLYLTVFWLHQDAKRPYGRFMTVRTLHNLPNINDFKNIYRTKCYRTKWVKRHLVEILLTFFTSTLVSTSSSFRFPAVSWFGETRGLRSGSWKEGKEKVNLSWHPPNLTFKFWKIRLEIQNFKNSTPLKSGKWHAWPVELFSWFSLKIT